MKVKGSLNSIENPLHHLADIPAGSQARAKHEDGPSDSRRNSLRLRLPTCLCFQTILKINMNCLIPSKLSLKQKISLRKRHSKSLNLIYLYRFWPQHQKLNMKKISFSRSRPRRKTLKYITASAANSVKMIHSHFYAFHLPPAFFDLFWAFFLFLAMAL